MTRLRFLMGIGGVASLLLILLAIDLTVGLLGVGERIGIPPNEPTDPGVALATAGLAIFTGLLFFAGALAATFAREEILTSTDVNGANLALQLDNRFVSDRALRIRHGAVSYLIETKEELKELKPEFNCQHDISPYSTGQKPRHGLNSDLIDLFNYFNWIGYLVIQRPRTIDTEVVYQKFGPWIINYYQICKDEIEKVRDAYYDARWRHLKPLYDELIAIEEEAEVRKTGAYSADRKLEDIKEFLRREHVRSHRGFSS